MLKVCMLMGRYGVKFWMRRKERGDEEMENEVCGGWRGNCGDQRSLCLGGFSILSPINFESGLILISIF